MNNLIATNKIENQILQSISKPVEKMGFELIRVRYFEKDKHSLQIMVDRNGTGIEIDDCAKISTIVSAILDVEDPIKFAYNLEISSPGINRPLTRKKDFEIWIGYNTKIKTFEPIEKRSTFKGILQGLKDDEILLQIEQGTIGLHLDWIKEASLSLSFDEMLKENTLNKTNHLDENQFDEIEIDKR